MPPPSRYPLLALTTAAVVFSALSSIPLLVRAEGSTRSITVANECTYTVWPGASPPPLPSPFHARGADAEWGRRQKALFTQTADFVPTQATGWEAASGTSVTFTVDEGWAGRIWGRCVVLLRIPSFLVLLRPPSSFFRDRGEEERADRSIVGRVGTTVTLRRTYRSMWCVLSSPQPRFTVLILRHPGRCVLREGV